MDRELVAATSSSRKGQNMTIAVRILFTGLMVLVPINENNKYVGMWALLLQTTPKDTGDDIVLHEPKLRYDCGDSAWCADSCTGAGGEMEDGFCYQPIDNLDLELDSPVIAEFEIEKPVLDRHVYSLQRLGLQSVHVAHPEILKRASENPPLEGSVSARMWVANGDVTARVADLLEICRWKLARKGSPGSFGFDTKLARRVVFEGGTNVTIDNDGNSVVEIISVNNRTNSVGRPFKIPTFDEESVEIWILNDPVAEHADALRKKWFLPHFELLAKISDKAPDKIPHRNERCVVYSKSVSPESLGIHGFPEPEIALWGVDPVICPGVWDRN